MLEQSFGLLFFLKKPKNQKGDERYVYTRITVDGIPKELSLKREWYEFRWDQNTGRAKGNKEDALKLNAYLDVFSASIYAAKSTLMLSGKEVTSQAIKEIISGNDKIKRPFLAHVFTDHNNEIKSLIGKDYAPKTYQKYITTYNHVDAFVKFKYGQPDVDVIDLNYEFIKDFSVWLKTAKKLNQNSANKYLTTLKSVVLECKRKKWISDNPFAEFAIKTVTPEIHPLYRDELAAIENKTFSIERLNVVKDAFLFSCYTGLAYVDICNLQRHQIVTGVDGEKWIMTQRQKTQTPQRVPLLPTALEIIAKYHDHIKCIDSHSVLPLFSNQKMNAYLKEIADVCGIGKKLTFHIARHTFATTVTLSNGVPIETVSRMLGHKSLKQTQHYAKIIDLKMSEDMAILRLKLSNK
jgi:site-specific recombinase XerD